MCEQNAKLGCNEQGKCLLHAKLDIYNMFKML